MRPRPTPDSHRPTSGPRRAALLLSAAALLCTALPGAVSAANTGDAPSASTFSSDVLNERYGSSRAFAEAIERYQEIADRGGFDSVEPDAVLTVGDSGPAVDALRKRLAQEGYRVEETGAYDDALAEAVRAMQQRHGLLVDGKVGPETAATLNVSAKDRVRQLQLNRERRSEALRSASADRAILVNLPEQRLHAWTGGDVTTMKVVVGEPDWATPRLEESLEYIEVNPYWTIPIEIIAAELKDEILADPSVLDEKKMKVFREIGPNAEPVDPSEVDWERIDGDDPESFPFYLRRMPGPENPLGRIKFMMPNRDDIYLHDTPEDALFSEHDRDRSHGCIRLEEPFELAAFLAPLTDWSASQFEQAVQTGENQSVALSETVPVDLVYWTAWVDADGHANFRDDIYDLDEL